MRLEQAKGARIWIAQAICSSVPNSFEVGSHSHPESVASTVTATEFEPIIRTMFCTARKESAALKLEMEWDLNPSLEASSACIPGGTDRNA